MEDTDKYLIKYIKYCFPYFIHIYNTDVAIMIMNLIILFNMYIIHERYKNG